MLEKIELENGLKIYLINDPNKHTAYINLIVKFGGINNKIIYNNKKHNIKSGTAHFLEHLVLESNECGDVMSIFSGNGVGSNGFTSIDRTQFYIDTVYDVTKYLTLLLKGIHNPIINKNVINKIKGPILEEKRRSLDNKNSSNIYNTSLSSVLNNKGFKSILGDLEDIESINEEDLVTAFNTFYRPENEIIVIGGRFDKEEVINTIKNIYSDIKFTKYPIKINKSIFKSKVNKRKCTVYEDVTLEKSIISFKIDTHNMKPYEKIMLDNYLYYFLKNNFGVTGNLNNYLVDNDIIIGNTYYSSNEIEDYLVIRVEANTKKMNEFNSIIIDYFKNKKFVFDEDFFNLCKRNYIIDLVVRSDDIYRTIDPLIENIVTYNYEGIDTIKDIEKIDFNKYKNMILNFDFSNYNISMLKRKN